MLVRISLFLLALEVVPCELLLELLDPARSVNKRSLSGKEGVRARPHIDLEFRDCSPDGHDDLAVVVNLAGWVPSGVGIAFHGCFLQYPPVSIRRATTIALALGWVNPGHAHARSPLLNHDIRVSSSTIRPMAVLHLTTLIAAPIERVFDLARSIDAHIATSDKTSETVVAGRKSGCIEFGESVTWEAQHLGRTQRLQVQITEFDRPNQFVDEMVKGAFRSFRHVHRFKLIGSDATQMTDELVFKAPWGPVGTFAEKAFLSRYLRSFLEERNQQLKQLAESDLWRSFLPETD